MANLCFPSLVNFDSFTKKYDKMISNSDNNDNNLLLMFYLFYGETTITDNDYVNISVIDNLDNEEDNKGDDEEDNDDEKAKDDEEDNIISTFVIVNIDIDFFLTDDIIVDNYYLCGIINYNNDNADEFCIIKKQWCKKIDVDEYGNFWCIYDTKTSNEQHGIEAYNNIDDIKQKYNNIIAVVLIHKSFV